MQGSSSPMSIASTRKSLYAQSRSHTVPNTTTQMSIIEMSMPAEDVVGTCHFLTPSDNYLFHERLHSGDKKQQCITLKIGFPLIILSQDERRNLLSPRNLLLWCPTSTPSSCHNAENSFQISEPTCQPHATSSESRVEAMYLTHPATPQFSFPNSNCAYRMLCKLRTCNMGCRTRQRAPTWVKTIVLQISNTISN